MTGQAAADTMCHYIQHRIRSGRQEKKNSEMPDSYNCCVIRIMALAPSGNGVKQKGPLNVLKSHIAKEESKIKCKFGVGKKGPVTTNAVTDAAHFNVSVKYP